MTPPTNDSNQTDLVAGYILDDLSPEESTSLDRALAELPGLQAEIASFQEAFALLPYDMPMMTPSARLKDKIISTARQSINQPIADTTPEALRSNVVTPVATPRKRPWQRWIPAIGGGITALVAIAFGLNQLSSQSQQMASLQQQLTAKNNELERLRSELQANQGAISLLSQPDAQMYALIGATSNPINGRIATARIVTKPGNFTMALFAHDLPKLSNNQVYRLWSVAKPSATPLYCGQFRQDDQGTAKWISPNMACAKNPTQLLITLDAPTDPVTSAGPLVMRTLI
jgi:Anti-sigma-K factor rskA